MNPLLSIISNILKKAVNASSDAFSYVTNSGSSSLMKTGNILNKSNPYLQTVSMLAPVGKYLYNVVFGNKNKGRQINMGNYTDAVQEFQNQDIDFASSLNIDKFNKRAYNTDQDLEGMQKILKLANENYSQANRQDTFRGNY